VGGSEFTTKVAPKTGFSRIFFWRKRNFVLLTADCVLVLPSGTDEPDLEKPSEKMLPLAALLGTKH
jgi:hypothetical protein